MLNRIGLCILTVISGLSVLALSACGSVPPAEVPVQEPLEEKMSAAEPLPQTDEKIIVAIDPGHGGINENNGYEDLGAYGNGYWEAELTYLEAKKLCALLEEDGRFAPVLTVDGTVYTRAKERTLSAAEQQAQLLLSIHWNSGEDGGFECYPVPPGRRHYEKSLQFAQCLQRELQALGVAPRGENGIRYMYFHGDDDVRWVAESYDTHVETDPTFGVLQYSRCPAVLVEQGFITYAPDLAVLTPDGCEPAARAFYGAVCAYFELEPNVL